MVTDRNLGCNTPRFQEGSYPSEPLPSSMRNCGPDRTRSDRIRGDAAELLHKT